MANMLVQFRVKDFTIWKKGFEANSDLRKSHGQFGGKIFRDSSDANLVTILSDWNSLENAQTFSRSPELKAAMAAGGVEGTPTFSFLNEA